LPSPERMPGPPKADSPVGRTIVFCRLPSVTSLPSCAKGRDLWYHRSLTDFLGRTQTMKLWSKRFTLATAGIAVGLMMGFALSDRAQAQAPAAKAPAPATKAPAPVVPASGGPKAGTFFK